MSPRLFRWSLWIWERLQRKPKEHPRAQTSYVVQQLEIRSARRQAEARVRAETRGAATVDSEADAMSVPPRAPVLLWHGAVIPGGKRRKQVTH